MKKRAGLWVMTLGLAALGASVMAQPARKAATPPPPLNTIEAGFANMGAKPPTPAAMPGKGTPPSTLDAQMQALSRPAAAPASSIEEGFMALTRAREEKVRAEERAAEARLVLEREREVVDARLDGERRDYIARSGAVCKAQMNKFDACYAAGCKLPPVQSGGPSNSQCEALPPRPYGAYRGVVLRGGGCDADCWATSEARIDAQYARDQQAAAIEQAKWDAQYGAINKSCTARAALLKPYAACVKDIRASCNPANVTEASCMASRAAKPLTVAESRAAGENVPAGGARNAVSKPPVKAAEKPRASPPPVLTRVTPAKSPQQAPDAPSPKTYLVEATAKFSGTAKTESEARQEAEAAMKRAGNNFYERFKRSGPITCTPGIAFGGVPGPVQCSVTAYYDAISDKPMPPSTPGTPCKEQGCGIAR